MKTDIEKAKENLDGHTLSLCRGEVLLTSDKKGISPMLDLVSEGKDVCGYSVADTVVGKAAAMLFIKAGIKEVYAVTMSRSAAEVLEKYDIAYSYGAMTENIINRAGNDICPMEKAVRDTCDIEQGYLLIKAERDKLISSQS